MSQIYSTSNNHLSELKSYNAKAQELAHNISNESNIFLAIAKEFYTCININEVNQSKIINFPNFAKDAFDFYCSDKNYRVFSGALVLGHTYSIIKIFTKNHDLLLEAIKNTLRGFEIRYSLFGVYKFHNINNEVLIYIAMPDFTGQLDTMTIKINQAVQFLLHLKPNQEKALSTLTTQGDNFINFVIDNNLFRCFAHCIINTENFQDTSAQIAASTFTATDIIQKIIISSRENIVKTITGQISSTIAYMLPENALSYITYKTDNDDIYLFIGLYEGLDSHNNFQNIPILRDKMNYLIAETANNYSAKQNKLIMEIVPNELLLSISNTNLKFLAINAIDVSTKAKSLNLCIYKDAIEEFVYGFICLSINRFNDNVYNAIIKLLQHKLDDNILHHYYLNQNLVCIYIRAKANDSILTSINWQKIEDTIDELSKPWLDKLFAKLEQIYGLSTATKMFVQYEKAFDIKYQKDYSANHAAIDIENAKRLIDSNQTVFHLEIVNQKSSNLFIYSLSKMMLSDILPILENLGFKVSSQAMYTLNASKKIWLYKFSIVPLNTHEFSDNLLKANVEDALYKVMDGSLASDSLSKLVILAGLNWREITILKALTRYLHQTSFAFGKGYVQQVLVKHYSCSKLLLELFENKFNPANEDIIKVQNIQHQIKKYLDLVSNNSEDLVLRSLHDLFEAIVRTNAFQLNASGKFKEYLSFKLNPHKILHLVAPIPYAEVFVYSNHFEAVHLRGGKIARGGIRWSDRGEDYRTEALGLMKAQMTKNSVIVPVGSKGAFFIKSNNTSFAKEAYLEHVIECYKNFLRGILDVTDNILAGNIIPPQDVVIYDESDPYLVVAADKGTASFSNYANEVAAEYNFWLGDAFASGGKTGYDHKKLAITSKGAWISVQRHFADMNIDVEKQNITVVGIGDMSGDVFGNGLLRSRTINLVAAFNHMHIFLDPNPDPNISYAERLRLFNMPFSQWSDYNTTLISNGGGVFDRNTKEIHLSSEAKKSLDISIDTISPDNLIKAILQAPVDLIWNGGIGTYIKSSNESHSDIGDKSNDILRCNASDIRASVIAEGGNLGVSQLARIEYSKIGGRINTDFIDNSAGVDCSDHEVNIKIVLNEAVRQGVVSIETRNNILTEMSPGVEKLVLEDNFKQTRALTIMEKSSSLNIELFADFIKKVEKSGLLNRKVEFLPSEKEIANRSKNNEHFTRPELAVILSYGKMLCNKKLHDSSLLDQKYFARYLVDYFPKIISQKFSDVLENNPLKKEIINTVVTNKIINHITAPILFSIEIHSPRSFDDLISAYFITNELFDLESIWAEIEVFDSNKNISSEIQIELFSEVIKILRRGITWLLKNNKGSFDIHHTIEEYRINVANLYKKLPDLFLGGAKDRFLSKSSYYKDKGLKDELASSLSSLEFAISIFDIISIAKKINVDEEKLANLYFTIGAMLDIDWLRKVTDSDISSSSYWGLLSKQVIKDELYSKQRILVERIASESKDCDFNNWCNLNENNYKIFKNFVNDLKMQKVLDLSMIVVANKKLELLI